MNSENRCSSFEQLALGPIDKKTAHSQHMVQCKIHGSLVAISKKLFGKFATS